MRRSIPTLLLIAATFAATACGDNSTTAPLASSKTSTGSMPRFAGYGAGFGDDGQDASVLNSSTTTTVTFDPAAGVLTAGTFTLTWRPHSVSLCSATGTDCVPLTSPIQVVVMTGVANGGPAIDIETLTGQHLTFSGPGARLATSFYAKTWQSILASGQHVGLLFAPTYGAVFEPNAPKSHFDPGTGELWRWVRHFSGYGGGFGDCPDPNAPTCAQAPDSQ